MILDIKKIKAALELARNELDGTEININNYNAEDVEKLNHASTFAWGAIRDALAALEAYDPDAIRRECLLDARAALNDAMVKAYVILSAALAVHEVKEEEAK